MHPSKLSMGFLYTNARIGKTRNMPSLPLIHGGWLTGLKEYKNPTTVRQNPLTGYFLTHFYVKLLATLPYTDIHPPKLSMLFLYDNVREAKTSNKGSPYWPAVTGLLNIPNIRILLQYAKTP